MSAKMAENGNRTHTSTN